MQKSGRTLQFRMLAIAALVLVSMVAIVVVLLGAQRSTQIEARKAQLNAGVKTVIGYMAMLHKQAKDGKLPEEEAKRLALEAVNQTSFGEGDNYFVWDRNGIELATTIAQFIGSDLNKVPTPSGKSLGAVWGEAVASGSGYARYDFPREKDGPPLPKLGYGELFEPWGFYVGSGSYLDDIERDFWRGVLKSLLGVAALIALACAALLSLGWSVVRSLGGEPAYAVAVMRGIAAGKLTLDIKTRKGDGASLLASLKGMQTDLKTIVVEIDAKAATVAEQSAQISQDAEQVASGTQRQADAAASMAAAIEELSVSVTHVRDSASEALTLTEEARASSVEARGVIGQARAEMQQISESVNGTAQHLQTLGDRVVSINSILNVIKEIADQTNLLALNAAIEAARAGEQGRGFAVVADEVRKLAERTAKSTQEIAGMAEGVQSSARTAREAMESAVNRVSRGVALANDSEAAMNIIAERAERVLDVNHQIANALNEQGSASEQIAKQVEVISEMSEENAASVRKVTAATVLMSGLAQQMQQSVQRFETH